jgi:A/G-specific adenine glycosylase
LEATPDVTLKKDEPLRQKKGGQNQMNGLKFTRQLMHWHENHNGRTLPWKGETDPYRIWLSEIILQQTRAEQGMPYYLKFIEAFPTVKALAAAKDDEVFKLWEGLGYYARCRNMLTAARQIMTDHDGVFPDTYEGLLQLKGIGPYTAAAIASFAYGLPHAVVDGNVYRVLARCFGIITPTDSAEGKKLFQSWADKVLDQNDPGAFNQAMMDHGATVCTPAAPKCEVCPVADGCVALRDGLISSLPVRAKKRAIRTRHFHYVLLLANDHIWIRRRDKKDIWPGLYEPLLLESETSLDRNDFLQHDTFKSLNIHTPIEYEGMLSQRLTHQLIHTHFFSAILNAPVEIPLEGSWIPLKQLNNYAFPRSLITLFQKKNYF